MSQYRSPWLDIPRAVAAVDYDLGVAAHYGEPIREQRWLLSGAMVDLSHRRVLKLSGDDRLSWLDSLTSQKVSSLQSGDSAQTLILTPQGRIEYVLHVLADDGALWILVEDAAAEGLISWLTKMRFRSKVEIEDVSADVAVLGSMVDITETIIELGVDPENIFGTWRDHWFDVAAGGISYSKTDDHPAQQWSWCETLIARKAFVTLGETLKTQIQISGEKALRQIAGSQAVEALRIEAWRPRVANEGDDKTLPHELDLLRSAVHLTKGCYRGQETVAKVHNLGHPPRRLTFLHLEGSLSALPKHGAAIHDEAGKTVGRLTTAAWHHELGLVALAVLRRNTPTDAELYVDAESSGMIQALQDVIVKPDSGGVAQMSVKRRRLL